MKRILATTALVMIMAGGVAYAAGPMGTYQSQPSDIEASSFIGQRIYATDTMPATDTVQPGAEKDWDDVGEINEVILGRDGQVKAVVLGVGGFLGMGEKDVAVPMQDVTFVKNGDGASDYFLVVNANKETLTSAPAFVSADDKMAEQQAAAANDAAAPAGGTMTAPTGDTTASAPAATATDPAANSNTAANTTAAPADTNTAADSTATATPPADANSAANTTAMNNNTAATDTTTTASTNTGAMTDDNRTRLTRPEVNREGYQAARMEELTAEKLQGATVYGPNDENVGSINRLVLDNSGKIDRVVLDVGGFLGMGAREIAVTMDELNIVRNANGDDVRVYIDANQANLKAQPEYKG